MIWNGQPERVIVPYTTEMRLELVTLSTTGHDTLVGSRADHCPRLNTFSDR